MNAIAAVIPAQSTALMPLSFIQRVHSIRPLNQRHVERIKRSMDENGVQPFPLRATPDGVLFAGAHRYAAMQALGLTEALIHIELPASLDAAALTDNAASEQVLPMTFVDHAELVWRKADGGQTLQAIGDELNWTKQQAHQYVNLRKLRESGTWSVVSTTVRDHSGQPSDERVDSQSTAVDFSERLLREIISLRPEQQLELVQRLVRGKCPKGRSYGKAEFKKEAASYRLGNDLEDQAHDHLRAKMAGPKLDEALKDVSEKIREPVYLNEAVDGKSLGPQALKLVQSFIDAYEKALNSKVIVKDMRDLDASDIPDGSVDAIVTDPPYPKEYVEHFDDLGKLAARVLKPGGSLICLVGQSYLPQYLDRLGRHLDYHWIIGVHMPGGQAVQLWAKDVNTFWKPALWFTKGQREGAWASDFIRTDVNNNDKRHHHWGQSEQLTAGLVDRASMPGDTVLDPFLGGGTTGVVCLTKGRKFIGVEFNPSVASAATMRIAEAAA